MAGENFNTEIIQSSTGQKSILPPFFVEESTGQYTVEGCVAASQIVDAARAILRDQYERKGNTLESPGDAADYVEVLFSDATRESFGALFLDSQHRVISAEMLFRGTIDTCEVHPREVLKRALYHNAAAVIFAHNHPSGISKPSIADRVLTSNLSKLLEEVDIKYLDHLIVGERVVSLNDFLAAEGAKNRKKARARSEAAKKGWVTRRKKAGAV